MSGCAICVYDLYETARENYRDELSLFRATLIRKGVPENQWPQSTRTSPVTERYNKVDVSLSAFRALEKSLSDRKS